VNTCACLFVHDLYTCLCICKPNLGSKPEASFQCFCTDRIVTYHLTTWHGWNRCTPAVLQGWLPNLILLMHPSFVHLPGTPVSVSKSRERVRDDDGGFQQPSSRSVVNRRSLEHTCCTLLAVLFANTSAVHEAGSALSISGLVCSSA